MRAAFTSCVLFEGGVYFVQELWIVQLLIVGGHYSRAASIRRNMVLVEISIIQRTTVQAVYQDGGLIECVFSIHVRSDDRMGE